MRLLKRRRRVNEPGELDITAFMNLMVVLVPFLLITAVFSRLAVHELTLPGPSAETTEAAEQGLNLEVVVRADALEIGDRRTGLLQRFAADEAGSFDYAAVSDFLAQVKLRHPETRDATILLEPEIEYQRLVDVMDTLRVARVEEGTAELFPDISIGDAPAAKGGKR
ncbi:biopolymer transporter ExbD [Thioalkalivibrio sp. XN8]|uniref:ExbD/TolR family protein n=1 Tax=Thioalkalivibrio sp. XN8 TaxID=2712863 RepID=UPI0013ED9E91|nr:biopolymer transporter ExbD [Thioalkalivibrio sp. XN8]NGP53096.1 biopolymer transporter ExbD [Thioalkalivibrio sp. XN8]